MSKINGYELLYTIGEEIPRSAKAGEALPVLYHFDNPPDWFLALLAGKLKVKTQKTKRRPTDPYDVLTVIFEEVE
jgi:hypothetical protein